MVESKKNPSNRMIGTEATTTATKPKPSKSTESKPTVLPWFHV